MADDDTLLARAVAQDRATPTDDTDPDALADAPGISARKTHIGGDEVDLAAPRTTVTFDDDNGLLAGDKGRPRPREFWTAAQLGQTAPMELIKITVTQQLTGGDPNTAAPDGDDLSGTMADVGDLIEDIYAGPHFQEQSLDNLLAAAVSDLVDTAFAYWELLPSEDGEFPVAGFKPLPPLQIQHNVDEDTGELVEDPAFWQVPFKRQGGSIRMGDSATALERETVVVMRDPQSARSDALYGESIATKVREWLELIVDVDVHQKRHYSDSQLPAGFLHFMGSIGDDKLESVEQDIVEASGDPHDLVTVSTEDQASWIPVGESVVDLDAIQEQQWYFKLVLAAAGLNANELGLVEGSGFAKETPALQRAIYKKVTKPFMNAIFQPQNTQVLPRIFDGFDTSLDGDLHLTLERFDPVQEQIEREEAERAWSNKALSLNEYRGDLGHEATEIPVEIAGTEVDLADAPRYVVDTLKAIESPGLTVDNGDGEGAASALPSDSHDSPGPPDFEADPVLDAEAAFEALGESYAPQAVRQLEDTIEVASSFIESVAYSRMSNFLQIEFEREGATNAVYWYGDVPEYRFRNILQASSKGRYFNKYIRGEYYYARLE